MLDRSVRLEQIERYLAGVDTARGAVLRFGSGRRLAPERRREIPAEGSTAAQLDPLAVLCVRLRGGGLDDRRFPDDGSSAPDLHRPVLGAESVRLRADLRGQRVALQPGDLVQSLANLRCAQL